MGEYDLRSNYDILFRELSKQSGMFTQVNLELQSDYQLIDKINKMLINLGCIPYTVEEINEISSNMN
jgi:hypothetical protein